MDADSTWLWDVTKLLVNPLFTIIVAILGYQFAFKKWLDEKKEESKLSAGKARFEQRLAACKAVWSLLVYLSNKEGEKTVILMDGPKDARKYFLRRSAAEEFLARLPKVFYEEGHGIFMPQEVREKLFTFASLVHRVMKAESDNERVEEILLKNDGVAVKANECREFLIKSLRTEIQADPDYFSDKE